MDLKNFVVPTPSFSGAIPQHYDQCLGPMFFEPYAIEIVKRIDPSSIQVAVELACGTGRVTRHLRGIILPSSKLVASDISEDMLAVAKEKLKDLDIDWKYIDAQKIPFNESSVDLVVCCFGYMFVPDKANAFAEAYRVLRPGGMLIFSTWDKLESNEASYTYRKLIKNIFGNNLPESYNLPFSMNDQETIKEMLQATGFSKIVVESVDKVTFSQSTKEAANGLARGGSLYNEIMKHDPLLVEELVVTLEKELSKKFGAAPMMAPMKAVICQAWK